MTADPRPPEMIETTFAQDLRDETLFEYELRESPLARGLSALPFDFTEQHFRESFRTLAAANPEGVMDPGSNRDCRHNVTAPQQMADSVKSHQ